MGSHYFNKHQSEAIQIREMISSASELHEDFCTNRWRQIIFTIAQECGKCGSILTWQGEKKISFSTDLTNLKTSKK